MHQGTSGCTLYPAVSLSGCTRVAHAHAFLILLTENFTELETVVMQDVPMCAAASLNLSLRIMTAGQIDRCMKLVPGGLTSERQQVFDAVVSDAVTREVQGCINSDSFEWQTFVFVLCQVAESYRRFIVERAAYGNNAFYFQDDSSLKTLMFTLEMLILEYQFKEKLCIDRLWCYVLCSRYVAKTESVSSVKTIRREVASIASIKAAEEASKSLNSARISIFANTKPNIQQEDHTKIKEYFKVWLVIYPNAPGQI